MIELTFLKELMLIRQANRKSAIFVTTDIFLDKVFNFQPHVSNGCHDLLMILSDMKLSDNAILNIKDADYRCIISRISKNEATNLMQNIDLKKLEHYKTCNLLSHLKMHK